MTANYSLQYYFVSNKHIYVLKAQTDLGLYITGAVIMCYVGIVTALQITSAFGL